MSAFLDLLRRPTQGFFDRTGQPFGGHDAMGRVLYANRALGRLFRLEPEQLVGESLHAGLAPNLGPPYRDFLAGCGVGPVEPAVFGFSLADGSPHLLFPSPLRAPGGGLLAIVFAVLPEALAARALEEHLAATTTLARSMLADLEATLSSVRDAADPSLQSLRERELAVLSPREFEVVQALAAGGRPADIAETMGLSRNTVRNHLKSIFRKTRVRDQAELIGRLRTWSGANAP